MATKQRRGTPSKTSNGREIMRPIISSDVMGNRNVEVVPVGAWVEPAYGDLQLDAVVAAKMEEEKINRLRDEKENRLRHFRRQVKKRVSHASQVKRQQQIQEAERAFELERKVIQQSYEMGTTSTRKDTCSLRNDDLEHAIKLRLLKKYGEDIDEWQSERLEGLSCDHEETTKVTDKARQQLVSKKISKSSQPSETKNARSLSSNSGKFNRDIQTPIVTTVVEMDPLPALSNGHKQGPGGLSEEEDEEEQEDIDENDNNNDDDFHSSDDDDDDDAEIENAKDGKVKEKLTVQFSDLRQPSKSKRTPRTRKSAPPKRPSSAKLASMLSQFTESDALARQKRQQAAVSRRIFMDREREAVRETIRRQEHRKRIVSLKKEKEAYRQELESLAQKEVEGANCDSEDEDDEEELRRRLEAVHFEEMVERRKQELRKSREMERYLDALRHNLIEKARRLGLQLPALCACGDIWDTHPETCANNCFFYKNNRAYARALQSLLASVEVM